MQESHARRDAALGIHPTYHDAPAPPWSGHPGWCTSRAPRCGRSRESISPGRNT
jgi:hypothetical protein